MAMSNHWPHHGPGQFSGKGGYYPNKQQKSPAPPVCFVCQGPHFVVNCPSQQQQSHPPRHVIPFFFFNFFASFFCLVFFKQLVFFKEPQLMLAQWSSSCCCWLPCSCCAKSSTSVRSMDQWPKWSCIEFIWPSAACYCR